MDEVPAVRGKKCKGNLRKKVDEKDSSDDEIDRTNLNDIKLQQSMRVKHSGTSSSGLLSVKTQSLVKERSSDSKTVEKLLETQFAVESEGGLHNSNTLPHEKLMEKYIDEKLGLGKSNGVEPKVLTEHDKLYLVPDEIKKIVNGGDQNLTQQQKLATQSSSGASTGGIAEVLLPTSFKLKNIEATKQAVSKQKHIDYLQQQNNKRSKTEESGYYQRFQLQDSNHNSFIQSASEELGIDDNEHDLNSFTELAVPIATSNQKSSDDKAMDKYRKQQGYRR